MPTINRAALLALRTPYKGTHHLGENQGVGPVALNTLQLNPTNQSKNREYVYVIIFVETDRRAYMTKQGAVLSGICVVQSII